MSELVVRADPENLDILLRHGKILADAGEWEAFEQLMNRVKISELDIIWRESPKYKREKLKKERRRDRRLLIRRGKEAIEELPEALLRLGEAILGRPIQLFKTVCALVIMLPILLPIGRIKTDYLDDIIARASATSRKQHKKTDTEGTSSPGEAEEESQAPDTSVDVGGDEDGADASPGPAAGGWRKILILVEVVLLTGIITALTIGVTIVVLRGFRLSMVSSFATTVLIQSILFTAVALLLRYLLCRPVSISDTHGEQIVKGVVYGLVIIGVGILVNLVLHVLGAQAAEQKILTDLVRYSGLGRGVVLLSAIFIVPIGEELLFRGYLFERLRPVAGTVTAYAVSSLAFALIHFNPAALAVYVVQAIVLAHAYHSRGSLLTAITAHAVNNGFFLVFASLSV